VRSQRLLPAIARVAQTAALFLNRLWALCYAPLATNHALPHSPAQELMFLAVDAERAPTFLHAPSLRHTRKFGAHTPLSLEHAVGHPTATPPYNTQAGPASVCLSLSDTHNMSAQSSSRKALRSLGTLLPHTLYGCGSAAAKERLSSSSNLLDIVLVDPTHSSQCIIISLNQPLD